MPHQPTIAPGFQLPDILKPHLPEYIPQYGADWFTFSAPVNYLLTPSLKDQKYLALLMMPADCALPAGKAFEDMRDALRTKLDGPGQCVNGFWSEASQGRIGLIFDICDRLLYLDYPYEHYYYYHTFMTIKASGAVYPVVFAGGETLELSGYNGNFVVTVEFSAGSLSLNAALQVINDAIKAAYDVYNEPNKPDIPPMQAGPKDGQLWIVSTHSSPDGNIAILGGTAVDPLGLSSPTILPEKPGVDNRREMFEESLNKFVADMSDDQVQQILPQYRSVLVWVVGEGAGVWPNCIQQDQYTIRGVNMQVGTIRCDYTDWWQVIAHEIGHDIGFPDLYEKKGIREIGEEPGPWCAMDGGYHNDAHPCAWLKAELTSKPGSSEAGWNDPWIPPGEVGVVLPPAANQVESREFLLAPTSSALPAINEFAGAYPGVQLVRAIRMEIEKSKTSGGEDIIQHSLYVEAREGASFSDPDFGSANYDTFAPGYEVHGGVIATDCVRDTDGVPRSQVVLVTPRFSPLLKPGDQTVPLYLSATNKITVRCKEIVRTKPSVYLIEVNWGPGSFFDLRIDPWQPPPYESPDIWVDSIENGYGVYSHSDPALNPDVPGNPIGQGDRLVPGLDTWVYARIWNDGDIPARDITVDFRIVVPAGKGPSIPIGTATISEIPPGEFRLASVPWKPEKPSEAHVCLEARIRKQQGELNFINNVAQENLTDWYLESGSPYEPVEFDWQVQNPLPERASFRAAVSGLKRGFHVDVKPFEFWLDPGEVMTGQARIWAEDSVLLESRKGVTPLISLEWQTPSTCTMRPIAGISGWAHPVLKSNVSARVLPSSLSHTPEPRTLELETKAETSEGSFSGANICIVVKKIDGSTVCATHATTDSAGRALSTIHLPDGYPTDRPYYADVILSPRKGTGPARTEIMLGF